MEKNRKIAFPDGVKLDIELVEEVQSLTNSELRKLKKLVEKEIRLSEGSIQEGFEERK